MSVNEWIAMLIGAVTLLGQFALLVRAYVKVNDLLEWQKTVMAHMHDRSTHLDPSRDGERWMELTKRLDKMEKKLDQIVQHELKYRNKGDTDE